MSDEEIHDTSRIDAFMAARRRAMVLHSVWRPLLAGAAGAGLVVAAVWVTLPKISYREIEIPRVTMRDVTVPNIVPKDVTVDHVVPKDVTVPNIVPKDVEIDIPRIAAATPAPRSPEERAFVGTEGWREAVIRGRIMRPDGNGFVMLTDAGEQSFYPARIGADGKIEFDPSVEDLVTPYLSDLGYCRKLPFGTYQCVALHAGREVLIQQGPIAYKQGRPT